MRGGADRFPEKTGVVEGMIYQLNTPGGLTTTQEPPPELIRRKADTKSEWEVLATSVSATVYPASSDTGLTAILLASRSCESDQGAPTNGLYASDSRPHGGCPRWYDIMDFAVSSSI